MDDTIEIAFSVILASLTAAIGWLVITVITNARELAVLRSRVNEGNVRPELAIVHSRVDDTGKKVAEMNGQLKQMNHTLMLIQEHLIKSTDKNE